MAIGPVQLLVFGFESPEFKGEVIDELARLRESNAVRVIDALVVYKTGDGDMVAGHFDNLTEDESIEFGSKVGALIGLGAYGEEGFVAGAELGAIAGEEGIRIFSDKTAAELLGTLPPDSAVALLLIEHHWAVPVRNAIWRAGGFNIASDFIRPRDLVAAGLISAIEAEELAALEKGGAEAGDEGGSVEGVDA
jgi:uncharacterized membrane protein